MLATAILGLPKWGHKAGGATWLAVETAAEAAELREGGLDGPLLVIGALSDVELEVALLAHADVACWRPRSSKLRLQLSWPQHVLRSRGVRPLVAAVAEEIRAVGIAGAVVARRQCADFRGAVDSGEHAVACTLYLSEQRIDVPTHQAAAPEDHFARDQDVADVPGGGRIVYSTRDAAVRDALQLWFDAQLSDHARHVHPG